MYAFDASSHSLLSCLLPLSASIGERILKSRIKWRIKDEKVDRGYEEDTRPRPLRRTVTWNPLDLMIAHAFLSFLFFSTHDCNYLESDTKIEKSSLRLESDTATTTAIHQLRVRYTYVCRRYNYLLDLTCLRHTNLLSYRHHPLCWSHAFSPFHHQIQAKQQCMMIGRAAKNSPKYRNLVVDDEGRFRNLK